MSELSDIVVDGDKKSEEKKIMPSELQKIPSEAQEQKTITVATISGIYHFEKVINFLEEIPYYLVFSLWIFVGCMVWTSDIACYFPENTIINIAINGILPFCNNNGYVYYNWCLLVFISIPLGIFLRCRDKIINTLLRGEYIKFSKTRIGLLRRNIFIRFFFNLEEIRLYLSTIQSNLGNLLPYKHFVFKIDQIKELHKLLKTKITKRFFILILGINTGIFILSIILQIINKSHFTSIIGLLPFKFYSFLFILKCYECIKYEDIISCANRDINYLLQDGQQNARFEVSTEKIMSTKEEKIKEKIREKIQTLLEEKRSSYENLSENDLVINFNDSENILSQVNIESYPNNIPDDKKIELQILCQLLQFHNRYSEGDGPDLLLTIQDFEEYKKYKIFEKRLLQEVLKGMAENDKNV